MITANYLCIPAIGLQPHVIADRDYPWAPVQFDPIDAPSVIAAGSHEQHEYLDKSGHYEVPSVVSRDDI